jgi:hypothetical protein
VHCISATFVLQAARESTLTKFSGLPAGVLRYAVL